MDSRRLLFALILVSLLLTSPGCDQSDPSESNARITEDGVDGVKFGDTIIDIRRILGDPQVISHLDGPLRSWYGAGYTTGEHAGLTVYSINIAGQPDTTVPVDAFVIRAPFGGQTSKGIEIGSTKQGLVDAFGEPELVRTLDNTSIEAYHFCAGKRDIEARVESDTVLTLTYGFYQPLLGWHTDCSRATKP